MAVVQERLVEVEADETVVSDRAPVGEEKAFRPYDPDQVLLMAPVLSEWIPEGDLAHFVSDLVESGTLDLSAIYDSYVEERGFPPYDPRLMVKLLVYGYANGVMSSRRLERATYRDVAVRMLCADQHPDYRSIARFRKRHLEALGELFVQALALCKREPARRAALAAEGKPPRSPRDGRDPFAPKPTAQRNFTDPESKIMKTADGSYHQCYNGQAVVDCVAQVIVVAELSDQAADQRQLEPALEQLDENLEAVGAELPEGRC